MIKTYDMMYQNGGNIMPVKIDGPAGRNEVTDEYRKNYDRIFNGSSASRNRSHKAWQCPDPRKCQVDQSESCKHCTCTPEKSNSDGGKNNG